MNSSVNLSKKPVVLCVDDDRSVLAALRRLFRTEPYEVVTAANAAQALAALRHNSVQVVIADQRMPEIVGSEFLGEVEQHWPWIGRVILTGDPGRSADGQDLEAGIDLLLRKPWNDEALKKTVRQLLRQAEWVRSHPRGENGESLHGVPAGEGGRPMIWSSERHVVVCVDDEPEVLSALRRSLGREPYLVLTTRNPHEALQWVLSRNVSAVVSDERMPEMTGTELGAQVRLHSPGTARILLTAYPGESAQGPGLQPSIECLIAKPWDDAMLRRAIREFLFERETPDPR